MRSGARPSNDPGSNQPLTSTSTWDASYVQMHTSPVESTGTSTEFGSTAPALMKFTCDASGGIGEPHGHTVKNPQPVGSTAVTFNATADTLCRWHTTVARDVDTERLPGRQPTERARPGRCACRRCEQERGLETQM